MSDMAIYEDNELHLQAELFSYGNHIHESFMNIPNNFDQLPLYIGERKNVKKESGEIEKHSDIYGDIKIDLLVHPSSFLDSESGKTMYSYPATRERRIMDGLKKIATDDGLETFGKDFVVRFTLRQVQFVMSQELHSTTPNSKKYSIPEIKEGLKILQNSNTDLIFEDIKTGAKEEYHSAQLQSLYIYEKGKEIKSVTDIDEDITHDTFCSAVFHPLITRDINTVEFRQINTLRLNGMTGAISHTLYRRMTIRYKQASNEHTYNIRISTARKISGLRYEKSNNIRDIREPVIYGFEDLKKQGVIARYEMVESYMEKLPGSRKKKTVDELYVLYPTKEFIEEQRRGNAIEEDVKNRYQVGKSLGTEQRIAVAKGGKANFTEALNQPSEIISRAAESLKQKEERRIN